MARHAPIIVGVGAFLALAYAESLMGPRFKDTDKALLLLVPLLLLATRLSYRATLVLIVALALVVDFFFFRPIHAFGFQNGSDLLRFTLFLAVASLLGFWASWTRGELTRRGAHVESSDRRLRVFRGAHSLTRQIANSQPGSNIVPLVLDRMRSEIGAKLVLLRVQGRDVEVVPAFSDPGADGNVFDAPRSFTSDQIAAYFPSGQWLLLPLATHVPHTLALRIGDAFGRVNMDVINLLTDLLSLAVDRQRQVPG